MRSACTRMGVAGDVGRRGEEVAELGEGRGRQDARSRVGPVGGGREAGPRGRVDRGDDLGGGADRGAGGVGGQADGDLLAVHRHLQRPAGRARGDELDGQVVAAFGAVGGGGDDDGGAGRGAEEGLGVPPVAVGEVRQLDEVGEGGEAPVQGLDALVELRRGHVLADEVLLVAGALMVGPLAVGPLPDARLRLAAAGRGDGDPSRPALRRHRRAELVAQVRPRVDVRHHRRLAGGAVRALPGHGERGRLAGAAGRLDGQEVALAFLEPDGPLDDDPVLRGGVPGDSAAAAACRTPGSRPAAGARRAGWG